MIQQTIFPFKIKATRAAIPRNGGGYKEGEEGKPRKDRDGRGFREDKRISRGIGAFSRREKPCGGNTSPWSRGGGGLSRSRRTKRDVKEGRLSSFIEPRSMVYTQPHTEMQFVTQANQSEVES